MFQEEQSVDYYHYKWAHESDSRWGIMMYTSCDDIIFITKTSDGLNNKLEQ